MKSHWALRSGWEDTGMGGQWGDGGRLGGNWDVDRTYAKASHPQRLAGCGGYWVGRSPPTRHAGAAGASAGPAAG